MIVALSAVAARRALQSRAHANLVQENGTRQILDSSKTVALISQEVKADPSIDTTVDVALTEDEVTEVVDSEVTFNVEGSNESESCVFSL